MDNPTIEKRHLNLELRADDKTIGGYAAVFYNNNPDTEFELWKNTKERISKDAFRSLMQSQDDVIVSYNHDMVTLLGRRSAGTLKLSVDETGLRWEVPYDNQDPDHVRIARKIQKREITGCSFAFRTKKDSWSKDGDLKVRTLEDVQVLELGPVVTPAYSGTSVGLRSKEAEDSLKKFETQQKILEIEQL